MTMKAANDNKPKQIELPKWLVGFGVTFPSSEADAYIEHDFHFGSDDLPPEGVILDFQTTRGRVVYVACIPDEVSYEVDWNNPGECGNDPDYVTSWHTEWYASEKEAKIALEIGLYGVSAIANDDDGTYGIDGEYDGGAYSRLVAS